MLSIPVNVFKDPNPETVLNIADKDLTFLISVKKTGESDFTLTVSDLVTKKPYCPYGGIPKDPARTAEEIRKRWCAQIIHQGFGPLPDSHGLDILA